ncbi:MAG: alpha/beta hydrolase [Bdellovibrio sp.]
MISDHKYIKVRDGLELYCSIRESGKKTWLIAVHGVGEHLTRHNYLHELFGNDFNIFQFDLRGHGKSHGARAWVENFFDYSRDLAEVTRYLYDHYKMQRYVLFGHSMGALVSSGFMKFHLNEAALSPEAIFLNAPPVGFPGPLGHMVRFLPKQIFQKLAEVKFSLPVSGLVDLNYLSHDPQVKTDYINDDLNCLSLHTKLLLELVKASGLVFDGPLHWPMPTYVTAGSEDRVVGFNDLVRYFKHTELKTKLKVFRGAYHEIHNEVEEFRKPYLEYLKQTLLAFA